MCPWWFVPLMTPKVLIWIGEFVLLKREIERLENRYLPKRSGNRQNRTHIISALLLLRNPREAMYDPESAYLELRDRDVDQMGSSQHAGLTHNIAWEAANLARGFVSIASINKDYFNYFPNCFGKQQELHQILKGTELNGTAPAPKTDLDTNRRGTEPERTDSRFIAFILEPMRIDANHRNPVKRLSNLDKFGARLISGS